MQREAEENLKVNLTDNPCRGIVMGLSKDFSLYQFAWIMGRSSNSQNRVYVKAADNGHELLRTEAADPSKVKDPSLIIYNVMRCAGLEEKAHIVSNGDQTDTVASAFDRADEIANMKRDWPGPTPGTFYDALDTRFCEPDAPVFTPRITGYQIAKEKRARLSLLFPERGPKMRWIESEKSSGLSKEQFKKEGLTDTEVAEAYYRAVGERAGFNHREFPTMRERFELELTPGFGYCLTTYRPGSKELPSYDKFPFLVPIVGTLEESLMHLWLALDDHGADHWRVSIAGKEIKVDGTYRIEVKNTRTKVN